MICTNWMLRDFDSYHLWAAWTSRHGSVSWLNKNCYIGELCIYFLQESSIQFQSSTVPRNSLIVSVAVLKSNNSEMAPPVEVTGTLTIFSMVFFMLWIGVTSIVEGVYWVGVKACLPRRQCSGHAGPTGGRPVHMCGCDESWMYVGLPIRGWVWGRHHTGGETVVQGSICRSVYWYLSRVSGEWSSTCTVVCRPERCMGKNVIDVKKCAIAEGGIWSNLKVSANILSMFSIAMWSPFWCVSWFNLLESKTVNDVEVNAARAVHAGAWKESFIRRFWTLIH